MTKRANSPRLPYAIDEWLGRAVDAMTDRELNEVWDILRRVARRIRLPRLRVYRTRGKQWAERQRRG